MQPIIRSATDADLPAIMELLRLKAEFDGCPEAFQATENQIRFACFSPSPRAHILLAEHEGEVIGIATYFQTFSTFLARPGLWLDDLYVRAAYRSHGVGKALMVGLARIAKEEGCGRMEWTVALSNDRGIAFYESLGATVRHLSRCVRLGDLAINELASEVT